MYLNWIRKSLEATSLRLKIVECYIVVNPVLDTYMIQIYIPLL